MNREFYVPCGPYAYPQCNNGGSTEVDVVSGGGGMDCMPLRPGPFHYLISEQAKSLVALQELQNEVGALLEFRDLVIETFPNLRHKMAASASASTASVTSSATSVPLPISSPSSRRAGEWEPGRVRRRVPAREGLEPSSSLPRSRSNSHSGGNKHSATVQDSGFSTETSSKDSASTAMPRPQSPRPVLDEAEDELWNLLDVIHRRGTRLREEVECLQGRLGSVAPEELGLSTDVLEAVRKVVARPEETTPGEKDEARLTALRGENERLLDKVAELEAETISSRARAEELHAELAALSTLKNGLEDRLGTEIESRIRTPGAQRMLPVASTPISAPPRVGEGSFAGGNASAFACVASGKSQKSRFRTRTIEKNVLANVARSSRDERTDEEGKRYPNRKSSSERLGRLDSVLVAPEEVTNVKNVDATKIAAILREHSPLELQRHLITATVHNQALRNRLDAAEKSSEDLGERLDKTREENDDLKFQLEERNIELEGTKARVRVLERLQRRPPTEIDPAECESEIQRGGGGGSGGGEHGCLEPGSSTESARDQRRTPETVVPSPRRRPSRIPLPGSKQTAPKPPGHGRNNSRESLKSLTRQPRDTSRESARSAAKGRDTSRDSLNKSLPRSGTLGANATRYETTRDASRESLNRSSLPRRNSSRESLNKSSSASSTSSRPKDSTDGRDSLESGGGPSPGTPPRRPPAPARRSHSLARASVESDTAKGLTDPPSSWCSSSGSFFHGQPSLCPDSLNQETSSLATGSTRVEFILGSPTRRFRTSSVWPRRYFDSIDSAAIIAESLLTDDFPLRRGEALAECDSLECHPVSSDA